MPELPEVEHICRYLRPKITGKKVTGVTVQDRAAARRPTTRPLEGKIGEIRRRGKLIIIAIAPDRSLVFHLKLTGKIWVLPKTESPSKWTRLSVHLGKTSLHFEDTRRLGWFDVMDTETLTKLTDEIGPEPLEPGFTFAVFRARLARRRGPIKPVLLDPGFVAGIGNIYADEILHAAKIHPEEPAQNLDPARLRRLFRAIPEVLSRAVKARRGVPGQDRVGSGSKTASKELELAVFQKTGEPCPRCRTKIVRTVVRGRGTHHCPRCQPLLFLP